MEHIYVKEEDIRIQVVNFDAYFLLSTSAVGMHNISGFENGDG